MRFVVNLVDEAIAEAMNQCAATLPFGENELTRTGLHAAPSSVVKPPRIAESPASLECVEWCHDPATRETPPMKTSRNLCPDCGLTHGDRGVVPSGGCPLADDRRRVRANPEQGGGPDTGSGDGQNCAAARFG